MKKMIYAVKQGRKTGIFNDWWKCSAQTDKYSNAKFRRFEYGRGLEQEAEDVPGSLRYAIKEAVDFLGDLVYLGGYADYLEDESWKEEGFLPFGDASEVEEPEFFSDESEEDEEDIGDFDEEPDEWLIDDRNPLGEQTESWEIEYWKIAEDMKKCVMIIQYGHSDTEKITAASDLKTHLERCLDDRNLTDLTAIYRRLRENNAIGYDPPAVAEFVTRMVNRYPKP